MGDDASRVSRERPDGVNKKKMSELDLNATIPIYYKPSSKSPNLQLVAAFPKEGLTLFSRAAMQASRKAQDGDGKLDLYQVRGGDVGSLKKVFDWIKDCLDQQSITRFPDILEPEDDPYGPTLRVIQAANILDIPAGSLQFFLTKRLEFIARKALMPFSQVREFYTVDSEPYQAGLKDIACASIFNAWWEYRLDANINPDLMDELSNLRREIPELDADLHEACKNKQEEVKKRKLEKKIKREVETQSHSPALGNEDVQDGHSSFATAGQVDGENHIASSAAAWDMAEDWNKENDVTGTANLGWDQAVAQSEVDQHKKPANDTQAGLDWADESAAEYRVKSQGPPMSISSPDSW